MRSSCSALNCGAAEMILATADSVSFGSLVGGEAVTPVMVWAIRPGALGRFGVDRPEQLGADLLGVKPD
jgi:hypothetical protein